MGCFESWGYDDIHHKGLIRGAFRDFLNNGDAILEIEIPDILDGVSLILRINKEDLLKIDFELFGNVAKLYTSNLKDLELRSLFSKIKRALLSQEADEMAEYFEEMIWSGPKVVKIFPVWDIKDKGYQFYRKNPSERAHKFWPISNGDLPSFFEIDLADPGSAAYIRSIYQLKHIAWMMQAYDVAFIMTQASEADLLSGLTLNRGDEYSLSIDDYVCIFNREGFMDSIYSVRTRTGYDKDMNNRNYQVILGENPGLYTGNLPWSYDVACTSGSSTADFTWYLESFIKSLDPLDQNYFKTLLSRYI